MRTPSLLLVLVSLAPIPAAAQTPGPRDVPAEVAAHTVETRELVARLLDSGEPRERAWGARLAADDGLAEYADRLAALATSKDEHPRVRNAAVDALVVLRVKVPAELAEALYDDYEDASIVLLSRAENADARVLALAGRETGGLRWLALNNLLAERKTPGFAAATLRDLRLLVTLSVSEDGNRGYGFGGGGGSVGCPGGGYDDGFPPMFFYRLVAGDRVGGELFAPGPRPIAFARLLYGGSADEQFDRDEARLEYLALLAEGWARDVRAATGLSAVEDVSVKWEGGDALRVEARAARASVGRRFAALVAKLRERGLLTDDEAAGLVPNVTVGVYDFRADRTTPLPEIP